MAVRFDADAEDYTRALALGTQTALTVACWFKVNVDRNTWSTIFFIDNGTSDNWGMQTSDDGVTMSTVFDATTQEGMGAVTVGTWYFVCLATSGTTGNLYYKAASASGLTTQGVTSVTASVNAATLRLGESPWGGEWLNGCLAAVRVWNTQLSAAEAQLESMQYTPNRLSNLLAFYPLVRPETTDYSGNARTLSGGSGAAVEDGPPIPWRGVSPGLILPAASSGVTATLDQATETDSGQSISFAKSIILSQSTETDTALGPTITKVALLSLAAETEQANSLILAKTVPLGLATEAETAFSIAASKAVVLGVATETDEAFTVSTSSDSTAGLDLATETDTTVSAGFTKTVTLGLATEADEAFESAAGTATYSLGLATETDTAQTLTPAKVVTLSTAVEADTANGLTTAKAAFGIATEAGAASALTLSKVYILGAATETDLAFTLVTSSVYEPLLDPVATIRSNPAAVVVRPNTARATVQT